MGKNLTKEKSYRTPYTLKILGIDLNICIILNLLKQDEHYKQKNKKL